MDGTYDSPFLTFIGDRTQNFLLPNNEEAIGLQDNNLNVEPMFTEIEDGSGTWSVGLPILMNGNFITEDEMVEESPASLNDSIGVSLLSSEHSQNSENSVESPENEIDFPIEIPGKGFVTADGLFITTNDLLLQLNLENGDAVNGDENITEPLSDVDKETTVLSTTELVADNVDTENYEGLSVTDEVTIDEGKILFSNNNVHDSALGKLDLLLNSNGEVININKSLLNGSVIQQELEIDKSTSDNNNDDENDHYNELCEVVIAQKCKKCAFLCEHRSDMIQHLKESHVAKENVGEEQNGCKSKITKYLIGEQKNKVRLITNVALESVLKSDINKQKDPSTVYLCSKCTLGYSTTEELKEHMILDHKLVVTTERQTKEAFSILVNAVEKEKIPELNAVEKPNNSILKVTAKVINKRVRASKKIKCSVKGCDLRFARDELRKRHEECHVEGPKKEFKCPECDSKFNAWRVCSMHLWKCHKVDTGLLTCPMCYSFKTLVPVRLVNHMAIHDEERPFLCSVCGKSFKQINQLRNHQIWHLDRAVDEMPDWANQQQCEMCQKYFANSKTLKKHIQSVHNKFKPFICNICGHKAARKAMLELHLRQHTGEKPHQCSMCEYKTGDHNSLRRHVMRHKGHMKYSCPHCDYQSIQSTSYKNHIASKHPGLGGSFYCLLCSYHTVNENAYTDHLKNHQNGLIEDRFKKTENLENIHDKLATIMGENLPSNEQRVEVEKTTSKDAEDDETQNCFLSLDHMDDTVDTGGITIPAGFELQVSL